MKDAMTVLCVGNARFCNSLCAMLTDDEGLRALRAITLIEAIRIFGENPDIDVIVLEEGFERRMDTMEFVVEIRRVSPVLMYVCCSDKNIGDQFMRAGCHNYLLNRKQVVEALDDFASSRL